MKFVSGARAFGSMAVLTAVAALLLSASQVSAQGRGRSRGVAPAPQPAPSAQPSPPQGGGGWRGARWMDRNGDGKIDLSEVPDSMRGRFESTLRDAGLDPAHGISVDRYEELSRQRFAQSGGFGAIGAGPGRDQRDRRRDGQPQGGSSAQAAPDVRPDVRLVPGFGNEFEESPVASFGEAKDDESWQHDYDPSVIATARDIIARYDTNKNGVLERSEWKAGQWRSDPNLSDRNKDGKLDLREMVERIVGQTKEDQRGRGPFGGQVAISLGGGNPGGVGGPPGGPGGRKQGFAGGDSFWRALDKNNDGRLDLAELAGNGWAQTAVRQAGFDPEKGVNLQEFLDARARSGGGAAGARGFRGFGSGAPGGGFGPGGGMGFGNPTAAFGMGDPSDAGMDTGDGSGSGDTVSDAARKTGARGNRGTAGASKPGAKKTEGATAASYRFQTAQELLPKDLPAWFLSKDKNGDGQVSMSEFSSTWTEAEVARFKQYDLNDDGIITAAEVSAVLAKSGRTTSREDSDTTAREDRQDAASESATTIETKAESSTEIKPTETKPASTASPASGAAASPSSGPSAANIEAAKDYMKRYDKNKNGVLEIDEWWTSKLLPAAEADVNGDEKITEEELANYFQKRFPNR